MLLSLWIGPSNPDHDAMLLRTKPTFRDLRWLHGSSGGA